MLFKKFVNIINSFINSHISFSIITGYIIVVLFNAFFFYPIIPIVLNYPPELTHSNYVAEWVGLSYLQQYILIYLIAVVAGALFLRKSLKSINWQFNNNNFKDEADKKKHVNILRKNCINLPYLIYFVQTLFVTLPLMLVLLLIGIPFLLAFKISILIFVFMTLTSVISLIIAKSLFRRILVHSYAGGLPEGNRLGISNKIIIQILPLFISAIFFTALLGYARMIEEKGDLTYQIYQNKLTKVMDGVSYIESIEHAKTLLRKVELVAKRDCFFIKSPENVYFTSNAAGLDLVFLKYLQEITPKHQDGRVFSFTSEIQGVIQEIAGTKGNWILGIKYELVSMKMITALFISIIILFILNLVILYVISRSMAKDISLVATNLREIASGAEVNLDQQIPVTSNDEIGDLVVAFNKIQELEKKNIANIKRKQEIILEQERLSALGQLIGGIAHNLRTPIMSLTGGIEGLKDLVMELDESVDDHNVTKDDYREIIGEMKQWLKDMRPYCSYMSDIITAVREQAVQFNVSSETGFTLEDLIKRVEILLKFELRKNNCNLDIDIQTDLSAIIKGELSSLIQVINNLIINAIQAYEDRNGRIQLRVAREKQKIIISIRDEGVGIPQKLQNQLFKKMITTKGANGTGIGLYMSYSTIKGKFNGDLYFESTEGKGTTFYIIIPL